MDSVRSLHFTTPTQLVSASEDCTLKVWDLSYVVHSQCMDFEPVMTLRGHTGPIMCMSGFEEEQQWWAGLVVSGGTDGSLALWQIPDTKQKEEAYLDLESSEVGD